MTNKLDIIIQQKHREVSALKEQLQQQAQHAINVFLRNQDLAKASQKFKQALAKPELSVIAEIKRKSPSKGDLAAIPDPLVLANLYRAGGADALSILTDTPFFGGSLQDLTQVATSQIAIPILRKDFIIDEIQIAEAIIAGADAILLIVAALGDQTQDLLKRAQEWGIETLVEVHNARELDIALNINAPIIGINNRDLTTFIIDTDQALHLAAQMPSSIIKVAESGILDPQLARDYYQAGFHAVLIGEALVTAQDPQRFIQECKHASTDH